MATVKSAMKLSTVSPLRWETMAPQPALRAMVNGGHRFAQGADLIELDEYGIGRVFLDTPGDPFNIGDKQVVPYQFNLVSQLS